MKVAIIGHGRSPEGQRWGQRIDACDAVIRMWDWAPWQQESDYGTRYDYGLFEAHPAMMAKFYAHKQRDPEKGWIASTLGDPKRCKLPPRTELVDQGPWNAIGRSLGGVGRTGRLQFTRGTIAACWGIVKAETGDEIVLVGFDMVHDGITLGLEKDFCPAYRKNPGTFSFTGWRAGLKKHGNHDYGAERKVLEYLAAQRAVNVSFAQDSWACVPA